MEKRRSFDGLTGLKGIFIFIIVWFHTLPKTPLMDRIPLTSFIGTYGGTLGNYMFFMLSGFLLSYSYRERIAKREISFRDFLMRRLRKLYPLYLLSNLVMLAGELVQHGISVINLKRIVLTLLLQNGGGLETAHPYNGPSWFVSALFVCYMAYYFVAYWSKNQTQYGCMIAFGIIWGYSIAIEGWTPPLSFGRCGAGFLNFFLGCALAEVYPHIPKKKWLQYGALLILTVSGFLLMRYGVEVISGDSKVAFAFVLCPLLLYVACGENLISRILGLKPVVYLGKISVSVYFWHFVIYDIFEFIHWKLFAATVGDAAYAVYLVVLILSSVLSYSLLENGRGMKDLSERCFR